LKTTRQQFRIYKDECKKWVAFFGLTDWRVTIILKDLGEGVAALCEWDINFSECRLLLNSIFADDETLNDKVIRRYAFHEVCHLLLARLHSLSETRYVRSEDAIDDEVHRIVRVLENAFLGQF